jgi:hypothetical protein
MGGGRSAPDDRSRQQNYKMTLRMIPKAVIPNMMIDGIARGQ